MGQPHIISSHIYIIKGGTSLRNYKNLKHYRSYLL
nr:MAG TPA: hypothetical protein [Caudoviricetes sp.]